MMKNKKQQKLHSILNRYNSILIAYSGGVDSTLLLHEAFQVLQTKAIAVTIESELIPTDEITDAKYFTKNLGIEHIIIPVDILSNPEFIKNSEMRCYICKKIILEKMIGIAKERSISAVAHGANMDDFNDFRPGMKAAKELGVIAPLVEAAFNKEEIRSLSKELSLKTFDKAEMACLASRVPTGNKITREKLKMIERSEKYLKEAGFTKYRVRHINETAKIEVAPQEFEKILNHKIRKKILKELKSYGFQTITVDLEGYKKGSMNHLNSI